MRTFPVISLLILLISCENISENEPGSNSTTERDWMDDYDKIISTLELKVDTSDLTFNQEELIILKPVLYASGKLIEKNDTVSGEILSNYDIFYTIDKELNLDSVYTNSAYKYFRTGAEPDIVVQEKLTKGVHYLSITCRLNSDPGFSKQVKQEITIE